MGLRATVMKEKLKHMLVERIEQLTRLNVSLEQERTKANEKADRYYGWWQEDETKLAEYEERIKELEAKLEVADLAPELEPFAKAETLDEVS
jgi:uncharacterized protein (UPF0305 family)